MARWQETPFFKTIVATSPVSTITVPSLDGDTDGMYLLMWDFLNTYSVGSGRQFELRLNGVTANHRSQYRRGAPPVVATKTGSICIGETAGGYNRGHAIVHASRYPRGSTVARNRFAYTRSVLWSYFAGGAGGLSEAGGIWANTTDNLTSIDFVCTSHGSLTKQASIGVNSVLQAFKLAA